MSNIIFPLNFHHLRYIKRWWDYINFLHLALVQVELSIRRSMIRFSSSTTLKSLGVVAREARGKPLSSTLRSYSLSSTSFKKFSLSTKSSCFCYSLFTLIVPAFRLFSPSPSVILRASFDSLILHYPLKLYCLYFWLIEFNGSLFWGMNLIILAWPEPQRRIDMRFIYIARKQMTFESEWTKFLVKLFTVWFSNLVFWQSLAASFSSGKNK